MPTGTIAIIGLTFACNSTDNGEPARSPAGSGGFATGGTASGGIAASGGSIASAGASGGALGGGGPSSGSGGLGGTLGGANGALAGSGGANAGSGGGLPGNGGANAGNGGSLALGPCRPPEDVEKPIEKLSQTGCMDATDLRKMANFVIAYDVNSPLWSDGADKERGMVLPPGQKIHVKNCTLEPDTCRNGPEDDGDWLFPVGSVLIKNFLFDGKLVETRLFVHADVKTWVGYGYQWDEAQTDATIVPDETRKVMFNTGQRTVEWTYPSRYDCMLCHNKPAGYTLGPETRQLNRMEDGKNLLDTLQELGAFDAPLPTPYPPALVTPYAVPEGTPPATAGNEELTRSYLHSNCAYCHRPEGDFQGIDMRLGIPFAQMGLCNVQPQKGGAGLTTGSLFTPGKPEESVLWARVKTLDEHDRMPQIGTYKVDEQGLKLITDWITATTACP